MTRAPRPQGRLILRWKSAPALVIAGSLMALSACNSGDPKSASNPSSSRPSTTPTVVSPSPSSLVDAESAAVLAAYSNSWTAHTEAYSKASSADTDLKKNTTFEALADIENNLSAMRKVGQVTTGKPVLHPKVIKVTDAKIPTAMVKDCVDTTHWTLIDKASKRKVPLPTTRLVKYVSTATLEKWGTKWMVTKLAAQDQPC